MNDIAIAAFEVMQATIIDQAKRIEELEADNVDLTRKADSLKGFALLASKYFDAQESAGHDVPAWVASMDVYLLFLRKSQNSKPGKLATEGT